MKKSIFYLFVALVLSSCGSKKAQLQKQAAELNASTSVGVSADSIKIPNKDNQRIKRSDKISDKPIHVKKEVISVNLPAVDREFRAAWVASVANINWPSKVGLTTQQQQIEVIAILDFLKQNHFNAVVFQVRPSGDALYKSDLEPWSYFLTGVEGQAPNPYYDPLEFWIAEAHKRGLELHVWLNPYRAHHPMGGPVSPVSIVNKMPESVLKLKQRGYYWFDPSLQSTQDHASRVVLDIVKRYDIDGVHFDDYFYPYAEYNGGQDFPDTQSWNVYVQNGGKLSRGDWRRNSVNTFIERVYKEIKAEKNAVKFGISPFGIWKPGYPAGVTGSSQYDMLYADAKLWLNKGWVDYYTPQLYWPIQPAKQSFTALLKWWESENTFRRNLWPGINTVGKSTPEYRTEIVNQIKASRELLPADRPGVVHWSLAGLTKNAGMSDAILTNVYQKDVLIPKSPWLKSNPLLTPSLILTEESDAYFAKWQHQQISEVRKWILYTCYGGEWTYEIFDPSVTFKQIPKRIGAKKLQYIAVVAVDRLSNESPYAVEEIVFK